MKKAEVEGLHLAYYESGTGEPVVFLHGITTSSFIWKNVIPHVNKNYRAITVDLLGCGNSDRPHDIDYSLQNQAYLLRKFIQFLKLEKIHLVGHDIGGGIAQIFAVRFSDLLYDLVLINPIGYNYWPVQPISTIRTPIIRQIAMAAFDRGILRIIVKRGLFHKNKLTEDLLTDFTNEMNTPSKRKAFLKLAKSLDNKELMVIKNKLTGLNIPVLIIRGDSDVYLNPIICERLHNDIPGSKYFKINSAGHFIQIDEPGWLSSQILNFYQNNR